MPIPLLRYSNPFRNQGYMMRLAGQRGGSMHVVRRLPRRRQRRQLDRGMKDALYKAFSTRQSGRGIKALLDFGVSLGKDKRYKRMGAIGARGHYHRITAPWEV